jgi:hypothetical protein
LAKRGKKFFPIYFEIQSALLYFDMQMPLAGKKLLYQRSHKMQAENKGLILSKFLKKNEKESVALKALQQINLLK